METPTKSPSKAECAPSPLKLRFDCHDPVHVFADDNDRFVTTVSQAALACKRAADTLRWAEEFKSFLAHLNKWCDAHAEAVESCFVSWCGDGLNVFIVTTGDGYRFDLSEAIADLDIGLSEIFPECPTEVMQIPDGDPDVHRSFFSPEKALQAYGNSGAACSESGE